MEQLTSKLSNIETTGELILRLSNLYLNKNISKQGFCNVISYAEIPEFESVKLLEFLYSDHRINDEEFENIIFESCHESGYRCKLLAQFITQLINDYQNCRSLIGNSNYFSILPGDIHNMIGNYILKRSSIDRLTSCVLIC